MYWFLTLFAQSFRNMLPRSPSIASRLSATVKVSNLAKSPASSLWAVYTRNSPSKSDADGTFSQAAASTSADANKIYLFIIVIF